MEFDDDAGIELRLGFARPGRTKNAPHHGFGIQAQPCGDAHILHNLLGYLERFLVLAGRLPADDVADPPLAGRHVGLATVQDDVAVAHDLAGLRSRVGEAQAIDRVVQPHLQQAQQVLSSDARPAHRLLVVAAELLLHDAVAAARLLLLTELEGAVGYSAPSWAAFARRRRPLLEGALGAEAALPLEHELVAVATAEPANRSGVSSNSQSPSESPTTHPATLGRAATVGWGRGDIAN